MLKTTILCLFLSMAMARAAMPEPWILKEVKLQEDYGPWFATFKTFAECEKAVEKIAKERGLTRAEPTSPYGSGAANLNYKAKNGEGVSFRCLGFPEENEQRLRSNNLQPKRDDRSGVAKGAHSR